MAADPNGDAGKSGIWEAPEDVPPWVTLPNGIVKTDVGKVWYAQFHTRNDGTVDIEWYKRGNQGEGATDPINQRSQATNPVVKKAWDDAQQTTANNPRQSPQPLPSNAAPTQTRKASDGLDHIYGYNPQTGLYDQDQGTVQAPPTARQTEGTPLSGGGFDNTRPVMVTRNAKTGEVIKSEPLTAAEREQWEKENGRQQAASDSKPVEGYPGWTTKTTKVGNDTKTVFVNPQGQEAPDPRPAANTPKPIQAPDGTYGYWDTTSSPPKWVPIAGGPNAAKTPIQINGQYGVWDNTSGTPVWKPVEAPTEKPAPPEVGDFTPDINKASFGLIEYTQKVWKLYSDGTITEKQKNDALQAAHASATAEAQRIDAVRASQQQSQQNDVSQRNADLQASVSRGNQSVQSVNNALDTGTKLSGMMTSKNFVPGLVPALMGVQLANAGAWGGLDRPAPVGTTQYPMLQGLNQLGMPPATVGGPAPAPTGAAPAAPVAAAPAAATGANALGLGAVGNQAAPGGATPLLPPQPMAPASPAAPAVVAPAAPTVPWDGQPGAPMLPPQPAFNPPAGEPDNTPGAPVGIAPTWQIQHPAVGATLSQPPDPSIDPQAWEQAVRQASQMLGLG